MIKKSLQRDCTEQHTKYIIITKPPRTIQARSNQLLFIYSKQVALLSESDLPCEEKKSCRLTLIWMEKKCAKLLTCSRPTCSCRGACTGRPAAGRPVLQGSQRKFSVKIFAEKPLPPRSGATRPGGRVYFCKFRKQKYIFVKNENEKIKKSPIWSRVV